MSRPRTNQKRGPSKWRDPRRGSLTIQTKTNDKLAFPAQIDYEEVRHLLRPRTVIDFGGGILALDELLARGTG